MSKSPRNQVSDLVNQHIDDYTDELVMEILAFLQEINTREAIPKAKETMSTIRSMRSMTAAAALFGYKPSTGSDITINLTPMTTHYYPTPGVPYGTGA